jgi:hypothetical protein
MRADRDDDRILAAKRCETIDRAIDEREVRRLAECIRDATQRLRTRRPRDLEVPGRANAREYDRAERATLHGRRINFERG